MREAGLGKALASAGKRVRVNLPLARDQVGDMGIAEHGEAVGAHRLAARKRIGETGFRLHGQAVHQIEIKRANAGRSEQLDRLRDSLGGLNATDRRLNCRIEGLNAEAGACDAGLGQGGSKLGVEPARVDFDRDQGRTAGAERLANMVYQRGKLMRSNSIGAAAAKGDSNNIAAAVQGLGDEVDLEVRRAR